MWIVLLLLNPWILPCTASSPPPSMPINATFSSVNLRNTLHWIPGSGTPSDTHFTVQYAIYGRSDVDSRGRRGPWRAVQQCTDISWRWCDLSSETWDLDEGYFARVCAVSRRTFSKWTVTTRFDPKVDTNFGPPLVFVEMEDNSATITLTGPMRYQSNPYAPVVSMATLYPQMMYNLSVHNKGRGKMNHFTVMSRQYKYRLLEYNTEYCFSAKAKFLSLPIQCQSSEWECITTPADPATGQQQRVVVGMAVSSVFICILVLIFYLLCQYLTGKGEKSPFILNPPSFIQSPLTFPPEQPNLIVISVIKPADMEKDISDPAFSKQHPCFGDRLPGSIPQRPGLPPQPEALREDGPIEYGFFAVGARREEEAKENKPKEKHNWTHLKYLSGNSLKMKEQKVEGGHFAGIYAPQKSLQMQTAQAHACSQARFQDMSKVDVRNKMGTECPGLFINTFSEICVFHVPLNPQAECRQEMRGEEDRQVRLVADRGVLERNKKEGMPLLSTYTSQDNDILTPYASQSDFLPEDYGILSLPTANESERDGEEEEKPLLFDWDPMTKLILPETMLHFINGDRSMLGKRGSGARMGAHKEEEEEEVNAKMGNLTLENVFVRQASEEEAEAMVMRGEEADDVLAKWDLVVSMDQ
ncbi:interleukin-20 receptor subunit alpha [Antennarius striatus]|uniref:interleukin-20 receptor subunit alpha n=1 Tax=Antennarius striatus TaxID=241820 RepID=UPI0035B1C3B2